LVLCLASVICATSTERHLRLRHRDAKNPTDGHSVEADVVNTTAPLSPPSGKKDVKKKRICLTFDDGPNPPVTGELIDLLDKNDAKSVFFMNCHEGVPLVKDTVEKMIKSGHLLGDHMCSHAIMTVRQYELKYSATETQKNKRGCLVSDTERSLFKQNVEGTVKFYSSLVPDLPKTGFKLIRFPGDGRFMPCLIDQIQNEDRAKALELSSLQHVGWTYEVAPSGTFPYVNYTTGVSGFSASYPYAPRDGAIVLAHDAHYIKGKLKRYGEWLQKLKDDGYEFGQLDLNGKCAKAST